MRNIEALRNYFLGKDPQLKETLADNSLRLIGIPGKEFVLRAELIARLKTLKDTLDKEDKRLQDEIDDLIQEAERLDSKFDNYVSILDFEHRLEDYYTKSQVDALLAVIPRFSIEVVDELPNPLEASPTTIYLVPAEDTETANYYNEYLLVNNTWELVGTTSIDMSDYYTKEEVDEKITFKYLTENLVIPENDAPDLATGWYNTGDYGVYYNDNEDPFTFPNELFYYDSNPLGPHFEFLPGGIDGNDMLRAFAWFDIDEHEWHLDGFWLTGTITNISTDNEVPSAKAVYDFVSSLGGDTTFTKLTQDLVVTYNSIAVSLSQGWYDTDTHSIYLSNDLVNPIAGPHTLFYLGNPPYFCFIVQSIEDNVYLRFDMFFDIGTNEWTLNKIAGNEFVRLGGDTMSGGLTTPNLTVGQRRTGSTTGVYSFVQGGDVEASGQFSNAQGTGSTASGNNSHAEGFCTTANSLAQHVQGENNVIDSTGTSSSRGTYAHIVGNGLSSNSRSNAHTLDWSGNAWFAGEVYVGSTSGTNKDAGSKRLITEDEVMQLLQDFATTNGLNMPT